MSTTKTTEPQETAEDALARIRSGFSGNDVAAIMAFAMRGVDPDDIEPRGNVLTFKAWKAAGRQVARGATSVPVVVWIPRKGKAVTDKTEDNPDGTKPARAGMMRRTARLFHISQTIELGAPKGTKPAAWWNPNLVKPGTYEVTDDDREQVEALIASMKEQVATAEREAAEAAEAASTLIEEDDTTDDEPEHTEPPANDEDDTHASAEPVLERRQINIMDLVDQKHDAGARQRVTEFKATTERDRVAARETRKLRGEFIFAHIGD